MPPVQTESRASAPGQEESGRPVLQPDAETETGDLIHAAEPGGLQQGPDHVLQGCWDHRNRL